ncbi:putative MFS sugar transporter [Choiromyces venosus 120613-1]|uniref:Putative MFS sugar transporter n=1 Tax=Choiromyces venosus 120613-1 TaxID=1336337 RepID=A0A3N4K3R2_9PEZI|nr:putative MFS sugar transporter [Choiromyces venosus 120613-1]
MGKLFTFSIAFFACLGSSLFGYDSGVMTDVIHSQHFLNYFNTDKAFPVLGAIISTFAGDAFFGAPSGGYTMDRFGRRMCAAVGIMSSAVPVYCTELAHPKTRGFLVGLSQQMIGVGFIVSTWVGYGSAQAPSTSSFQWRFPLAFQGVPAGILAIGLFWFPESPRQLIEKDNDVEATRILRKLHFDGYNEEWINSEFDIRQTIQAKKALVVRSWKVMFTVPQWRTSLMHRVLVQVFTQLTGINVINYYQTTMYGALDIEGNKALLVTGIYNCVGPLAKLFFIFFPHRQSWTLQTLLFGARRSTQKNPKGDKGGMSIAGVAMIFLASIIFSFSFGPVSWTYMSEVMPMQIRGNGNAFATGFGNWLVNVIFSQASPQGLANLARKYYFVFVAVGASFHIGDDVAVTLPTIFFVFKETKGVSLEEIDLLFGKRTLGALPSDMEKQDFVPFLVEMYEMRKGCL